MFLKDEIQERAAASDAKTVIVQGGPGSGKTHLLARRLARLTLHKNVPLSSILVFTFSSAAAERFRRLIERQFSESYEELWIHTFYSFAMAVIDSSEWNLPRPPLFISPFKEYLIVREILRREKSSLAGNFRKVAGKEGFARELSDVFKLLKQNLLSPEQFRLVTGNLSTDLSDLAHLYEVFENVLREKNYSSVSDSIVRAAGLLKNRPEVHREYVEKFKYILIDEFEEIDPAQFELLKLLLGPDTSVFIAGDEEQRIYGFRGSGTGRWDYVRTLRQPIEEFRLQAEFRLPKGVREAAGRLLRGGSDVDEKSDGDDSASSLQVVRHEDPIEQAYAVARDIKMRLLEGGRGESPISCSDFAVLCRSTARSSLPLQEAFGYYEIPYVLCNATSFYLHPSVRFLADLVRFLGSADDDDALMRVLNIPAFKIDSIELKRMTGHVLSGGGANLYEGLRELMLDADEQFPMNREEMQKVTRALGYLEALRMKLHAGEPPAMIFRSVIQELFFREILDEELDRGIEDARNLNLFDQVLTDIEDIFRDLRGECSFAAISEYIEHAFAHFSYQQEMHFPDDLPEGVRIMTIHQAKGLEFRFVYIVDVTDDRFPSLDRRISLLEGESVAKLSRALGREFDMSSFSSPYFSFLMSPQDHLRDERQLLYVAVTRASKRLSVHFTEESHFSEAVEPSPFVYDLLGGSGAIVDGTSAEASADAAGLISAALNREEIESALHSAVSNSEEAATRLRPHLRMLGLDEEYVCSQRLFRPEPAVPPVLEGHVFSASQLSIYLSCPRRFFYERMLRIGPEQVDALDMGRLVHAVLEEFHGKVKRYRENEAALEAELLSIFRRLWIGEGRGSGEGFQDRFANALQREAVRRKAEEILKRYLKTELSQAKNTQVAACELQSTFQVRGLAFQARIDRIDTLPDEGGHRIIDYKTSKNGPMTPKTIKKLFLNIDCVPDYIPQDFQLPLYVLAGRAAGYQPAELTYYWVAQWNAAGAFKKSSLAIGHEGDCLSPEELEAAEEGVIASARKILSGDFPAEPRSNMECRRCVFFQICDE